MRKQNVQEEQLISWKYSDNFIGSRSFSSYEFMLKCDPKGQNFLCLGGIPQTHNSWGDSQLTVNCELLRIRLKIYSFKFLVQAPKFSYWILANGWAVLVELIASFKAACTHKCQRNAFIHSKIFILFYTYYNQISIIWIQ